MRFLLFVHCYRHSPLNFQIQMDSLRRRYPSQALSVSTNHRSRITLQDHASFWLVGILTPDYHVLILMIILLSFSDLRRMLSVSFCYHCLFWLDCSTIVQWYCENMYWFYENRKGKHLLTYILNISIFVLFSTNCICISK